MTAPDFHAVAIGASALMAPYGAVSKRKARAATRSRYRSRVTALVPLSHRPSRGNDQRGEARPSDVETRPVNGCESKSGSLSPY